MNLLIHVHLHRLIDPSGVGRVTRNLIEKLSACGKDDLRLLCKRPADDLVAQLGDPWRAFRYYNFGRGVSAQQAMWLFTRRPAAEHWWPEADVVYSPAESYVPARRARTAVTVHDMALFERHAHRQDLRFRLQQAKWRVLFATFDRRADMIHVVSRFTGDRLAHFYPGLRPRIRMVPNAVAPRFFEAPRDSNQLILAELGLRGRRFVLLPGGLHYRKNADLVLAAWAEIARADKDVQLVIAGRNDAEWERQAKSLSRVVPLGYVDDATLFALYHGAQLVWFPSRYEGFGLPVLEAMACGAPVVASNSSSIPEIAGGAALLLDPLSPMEQAEGVTTLLRDDGRRAGMSVDGRARASDYTWEATAVGLRGHLEELA